MYLDVAVPGKYSNKQYEEPGKPSFTKYTQL
jgi:hypothetical protein